MEDGEVMSGKSKWATEVVMKGGRERSGRRLPWRGADGRRWSGYGGRARRPCAHAGGGPALSE